MIDKYLMKDLTNDIWRKIICERPAAKDFCERLAAKDFCERPAAEDFYKRPALKLRSSLYIVAGTKNGCVSAAWQEFSEIDPWKHKQFDVI